MQTKFIRTTSRYSVIFLLATGLSSIAIAQGSKVPTHEETIDACLLKVDEATAKELKSADGVQLTNKQIRMILRQNARMSQACIGKYSDSVEALLNGLKERNKSRMKIKISPRNQGGGEAL